ncbi:MAG: type II toxin-antitoxin system PemK/MazF family toxin [bacterium]
MEEFVKGDVVVIPFPFSDLSQAKRRPACVVTVLEGDDLILCQITSQTVKDRYSVQIQDSDFVDGALKLISNVRPNRLFTADKALILYRIGKLNRSKITGIVDKIVEIIRN